MSETVHCGLREHISAGVIGGEVETRSARLPAPQSPSPPASQLQPQGLDKSFYLFSSLCTLRPGVPARHLLTSPIVDTRPFVNMPSRSLPNLMAMEVAEQKTAKSCWVTIGSKVYDMTEFLDQHPGGGELILEYGGKDVRAIMQDEVSHSHSESAYDYLDDHLIGFVATDPVLRAAVASDHPQDILPLPPNESGAQELRMNGAAEHVPAQEACPTTGMSSVDDLYRETDIAEDFRRYKFLNLEKPLLMQVWNGGFSKDFYLAEVHRPRVYNPNLSPPLFGNFLEPLSKTAWWVVPTLWLPCVAFGSWLAYLGLPNFFQFAAYWLTGWYSGLWLNMVCTVACSMLISKS